MGEDVGVDVGVGVGVGLGRGAIIVKDIKHCPIQESESKKTINFAQPEHASRDSYCCDKKVVLTRFGRVLSHKCSYRSLKSLSLTVAQGLT